MSFVPETIITQKEWTDAELVGLALAFRNKHSLLRKLVFAYDSFDEAIEAQASELSQLQMTANSLFEPLPAEKIRQAGEKQIEGIEKFGGKIVTYWNSLFPDLLRRTAAPPTILYVHGELQPQNTASIGIVGTRKNTDYGAVVTKDFCIKFAEAGAIVVSGLAFGIDSLAHKNTIDAGGITYACIASGLDRISPSISKKLAESIVHSGGAVISEYPLGTNALPGYFPQRNRIIAGISQALVVVESAERGGSLITAQIALDENRDIFAVPGRITSDRSRGTNLLIAQSKAAPALSPRDVLSAVGLQVHEPTAQTQLQPLSREEAGLYSLLSDDPIHIDVLAEKTSMATHELLVILLGLEFNGLIRQLPGKLFAKVHQ